jgi:hypothetical protein
VSGKYYRQGDAVQVVTVNGVADWWHVHPRRRRFDDCHDRLQRFGGDRADGHPGAADRCRCGCDRFGFRPVHGDVRSGRITDLGGYERADRWHDPVGHRRPVARTSTRVFVPSAATGRSAAWGQGMEITIKISNEANYWDGSNWHSAFQENLVLLLVEAYYGFLVNDVNAFCAYTHSAGS